MSYSVYVSLALVFLCYPFFPPNPSLCFFWIVCLFFSQNACRWENWIQALATVVLINIYNALFLYFGMSAAQCQNKIRLDFVIFRLNHLACQNCNSISGQLLFDVTCFAVHLMYLSLCFLFLGKLFSSSAMLPGSLRQWTWELNHFESWTGIVVNICQEVITEHPF